MERNTDRPGRKPPHVLLILAALLLLASALTWLIPAGSYERVLNEAAGQTVVVPGSFAYTQPSPVSPWQLPARCSRPCPPGRRPN